MPWDFFDAGGYFTFTPYVGNFKTALRKDPYLKTAARFLNATGSPSAWASGGTGQNNGAQLASPYDQNVSVGNLNSGPNPPGLYTALIAKSAALTHCLASLSDTTGALFTLCDLTIGLDPTALPAGVLTAVQVTNGIINSSTAISGWRIIFDSTLIIGSRLNFNASINLVHAELGTQYLGQATLQSPWNYIATNPRLAQTTAGGDLEWFYDAGQPAVTNWQLWTQGFNNPGSIAATLASNVFTYSPGPGLFWVVGVDGTGNPVTPASNVIAS